MLQSRPAGIAYAAIAAFVTCVYVGAALLLTRTSPLAPYLFIALLCSPVAIYLTLTRPVIFPFALYILLVPFDNLLGGTHFGTLTKVLGIVVGVCLLAWLARRLVFARPGKPLLVLALLIAWMLLTTAWSLNLQDCFDVLPTYEGLALLYGALALTPITRKQYAIIFGLVALSGLAAAAYGAEMFYSHPYLAETSNQIRLVLHNDNSRIDPNQFAASLLYPAAVVIMWTLRSSRIVFKIAGFSALALLSLAITLSGSRGAFIGLCVVVLYFIIRSPKRVQLIAICGVTGAILASAQTSIWMRFALALSTGGSGRTSIWAVGIEAAKHRPVFGYGIGNFQQAYDLYYLGIPQTYPYGFTSPAHNIVLHYVVELGVIGMLLLGWFFWEQWRSLSTIRPKSDLYDYRITMEASLLAVVVMSLTIDLFTYKYAWLVFASIALLHNLSPHPQARADIRSASASMIPARSSRA